MDVDMAATIAWCLMGAVVVGAVLTYGCMHRLVSQAYEEGLQDHLRRVPPAAAAVPCQETLMEETPTSAQPPAESAA